MWLSFLGATAGFLAKKQRKLGEFLPKRHRTPVENRQQTKTINKLNGNINAILHGTKRNQTDPKVTQRNNTDFDQNWPYHGAKTVNCTKKAKTWRIWIAIMGATAGFLAKRRRKLWEFPRKKPTHQKKVRTGRRQRSHPEDKRTLYNIL